MAPQSITAGLALLIFTIVSGILPAIFWLWFWLREDKKRPEPIWVIILVFILGSLAVIPAYYLEKYVSGDGFSLNSNPNSRGVLAVILIWAMIEETLKYFVVAFTALKSRYFDEPVDAMVYMITGALGFAAVENTLFMLNSLNQDGGSSLNFLLTGNFRFIGATIVHIVASAIIGCFIGLAFYSSLWKRIVAVIAGLTISISLHALFNYSIISQGEDGRIMLAFIILWILAILVIFLFERVKKTIIQIKTNKLNQNVS